MVDFAVAQTEVEFIESIRDIFRAYVPESDAWAQPNFFSINATIIGGLAWSAVNEAQNGFDARVNLQTAQGEFLDLLAAQPPLNMFRLSATVSEGFVAVTGWTGANIPAGHILQTAEGVAFKVTTATPVTAGQATAPVTSALSGQSNNSLTGQPLISNNGAGVSLGIFGGFDSESDDQFRGRVYAERTKYAFFGSACSYERLLLAIPGVSRSWIVEDGAIVKIVFLMEDKYPCGIPLPQDILDVQAALNDPCLVTPYFCPVYDAACSLSIDLTVLWDSPPPDICEIQDALILWLRANYDLNEGVRACDLDLWFRSNYGEYGPVIDCCEDFPASPCCVYNCAELTPSCDPF